MTTATAPAPAVPSSHFATTKETLLALVDGNAPVLVWLERYCASSTLGAPLGDVPFAERELPNPVFSCDFCVFTAADVKEIKPQYSIAGRVVTKITLR